MRTHLAALLLLLPSAAAGQDADAFKQRVLDAYGDTKQYLAVNTYVGREKQGGWRVTRAAEFRIALDREAGKLLVDTPDVHAVIDAGKLRMRSKRQPKRHLEIAAPDPLTYRALIESLPMLARPELPDLMLLLGEDPAAAARDPKVEALDPDAKDPKKRLRLRVQDARFMIQLFVEPDSLLATAAQIQWNPLALRRPADDQIHMLHEIRIQMRDEPIPAGTFRFDIVGSKAFSSLEKLAGRHALLGKPAPPLELTGTDGRPVQLKAPASLVCFWAAWFSDRTRELEALERVHEWAGSNPLLEAVSVNLGDESHVVKAEVGALNLKAPALLAANADAVVAAWDAQELPRAVIISNGKGVAVLDTLVGQNEKLKQFAARLKASQGGTTQPKQ